MYEYDLTRLFRLGFSQGKSTLGRGERCLIQSAASAEARWSRMERLRQGSKDGDVYHAAARPLNATIPDPDILELSSAGFWASIRNQSWEWLRARSAIRR